MSFLRIAVFLVFACLTGHAASSDVSSENPPPQLRTFAFLCRHFCKGTSPLYDEDYSDYSYLEDEELEDSYGFRSDTDTDKPRIFCELCKRKHKIPSTMKPATEKPDSMMTTQKLPQMTTKKPPQTTTKKPPQTTTMEVSTLQS